MMYLKPAFIMLSTTASLTAEKVSGERLIVPGKRISSVLGANGMTGATKAFPNSRAMRSRVRERFGRAGHAVCTQHRRDAFPRHNQPFARNLLCGQRSGSRQHDESG